MKDKSEIEQPGTPNETDLTTVEGKRLAAAASDRGKLNFSTAIRVIRLVHTEFISKCPSFSAFLFVNCKILGCVLTSPFSL